MWFWIKLFVIDVWEGSEYASSSDYASVTRVSVENGWPYSSRSQYARAWIYIGYEYVKVTYGSV